jgi:hypothetical protein
MHMFGCRCVGDLVVSGIRANLDALRPSDLPKLPNVNRAEECLVRERRENTASDVAGEINDALCPIGICNPQTVFWKRFDFYRPVHEEKMFAVFRSASGEWPKPA